jgi:hypothetical protein
VSVKIPCLCPPKADGGPRHEHDEVKLRDKLGFREAEAIRNTLVIAKGEDPDLSAGEILAILTEGYILHGVESWTIQDLDDKNRPFTVPVTKPNIREKLLSDPVLAQPIGDVADDLYKEAVYLPLVRRALASSEPSQTDESTSASPSDPKTPTGSPSPRKLSKRSSTTTIQTGGTATITSLHGGGSSSSPSSASAA